jgi:putative oxidoreductase
MELHPQNIAPLLARLLLGVLFFSQGYDKVFRIGIPQVIETVAPAYRKLRMPGGIIRLSAYFTSWVELIGGLLLIAGLFKYGALYLLGADLLLVSLAFSLLNPVWDLHHVFYRFALLVFLLVYPAALDTVQLSALFR